ncbi:MAG TPA: Eco29kI family restriction endonuclease [Pirellulaceae bacterium]|nr:Eco29kI family restriction endonuclease [Pirellulaceae bacterium]HMO94441.1 Eco29kI family restriction endonuclease [Pirellulaceae bacterium]HMP71621.1 Eco29kI family restriction endonuclease [Pirellulaceae bacterium]
MAKKRTGKATTRCHQTEPFDRSKHVYTNTAFVELVKDAIRFFNGTPVHALPPPERFHGTGVYAIYYTGRSMPYGKYSELNRLAYDFPIYVGKAVPKGWRQSRQADMSAQQSTELYSRLREHARSIAAAKNLSIDDFSCRFMIFEGASSDMIGTLEASIIKWKRPLWNSFLDGFGNHTPGKGRFEQARSEWDVIHPGRPWAEKCKGKTRARQTIMAGIEAFLAEVGNTDSSPMSPSGGEAFS